MMPLQLHSAIHSDIEAIIQVVYAANADPHDPFVDLCLPGLGHDSPTPRAQGEKDTAERYLKEWKETPTQHWLKVVDTDTGAIISASKWEIFDHNPYAEGLPKIEADWLPAGSRLREYAEFLINTRYRQAAARCECAHVWLDICVTLPEHRRRGAASMMLQWGIDRADEMDVEAFIEATIEGQQLYEHFGFVTRAMMDVKSGEMESDEEWKELEETWPLRYRWMERPKKSQAT